MGHPTIYPTGATVYQPEKASSGYTIYQAADLGALLIDMNGKEVHLWKGLRGFPNKLLPGGYVLGSTAERDPKYGFQDEVGLVILGLMGFTMDRVFNQFGKVILKRYNVVRN